jgi:TolB-like protein/Flp pilus assembly protein TadD
LLSASWYWNVTPPELRKNSEVSEAIRTIAVMPFENPAGDPEIQYLCDGIAESLINWLATVPDVKVVSKSASFRMREDTDNTSRLADALDVDSVLRGKLEMVNGQVSISASLVDTRDETQLWGERLSRPGNEVLSLERSIVSAITDGLSLKVSQQAGQATTGGTDSDEAYQRYLRGHYLIQATSGDSIDQGLKELRAAIEIDPSFGLPYTDMADALVQKIFYTIDRTDEQVGEARMAARQAIALSPDLAEAHTALAGIHVYFDYDWAAGQQAYEKAISLNPSSPVPFHRYSDYLWLMLDFEKSIEMAERALEVDPLDSSSLHALGFSNMLAGNYDAAVASFAEWNQFYPQSWWSYVKYGAALALNDQCDLSTQNINRAETLSGGEGSPLMQSWMAWAYYLCGEVELFERLKQRLESDFDVDGIGEPSAMVWLGLIENDVERVISGIENVYHRKSSNVPFIAMFSLDSIKVEGAASLRADPRYQALLTELNFPRQD